MPAAVDRPETIWDTETFTVKIQSHAPHLQTHAVASIICWFVSQFRGIFYSLSSNPSGASRPLKRPGFLHYVPNLPLLVLAPPRRRGCSSFLPYCETPVVKLIVVNEWPCGRLNHFDGITACLFRRCYHRLGVLCRDVWRLGRNLPSHGSCSPPLSSQLRRYL